MVTQRFIKKATIIAAVALMLVGCNKKADVLSGAEMTTTADVTKEEMNTEAISDTGTENVNKYNEDLLGEWHGKQEEEAYSLIREVLLGNEVFVYCGDLSGNNSGLMNMEKMLEEVFENKADTDSWKFMFLDLDGDDAVNECVLRCTDSERHYNIVFHYFAGQVYASELTFRDGKTIYKNGLIEGSGSASSTYWCRVAFDFGEKAYHRNVAGWYFAQTIFKSLDYKEYENVSDGDRREAWITVDGVLTEVPKEVFSEWAEKNNFPGELADEYDFNEENINKYIK